MAYLWTTTDMIQKYLDIDSTMKIGDDSDGNFSVGSAEVFENDSVYEIKTMLSAAFSIVPDDNVDLERMAAKLTASKIGTSRIGSGIGNVPDWTIRYKNEVFSQLIRMLINHNTVNIEGATKRDDVNLADILILAKVREQVVASDS